VKQKFIKLKNTKFNFKLRLAKIQDLKFVFNLYNKNVLEKKFFSLKKVSLNEHKIWFKNKIKEKMFYVCSLKERLGYIRFDKTDEKNLTISIAITSRYKKKGYGRNMLIKALSKKSILNYNVWAYVKKNNHTSKKFFLNAGFKLVKNNRYMIKN
jgi:L-amino acid N-acyltransferase YncA